MHRTLPLGFLSLLNLQLGRTFTHSRYQARHQVFPKRVSYTTTLHSSNNNKSNNMGWDSTWDDILQGGSQRWKIKDPQAHEKVLLHMQQFFIKEKSNHILAPLAGDDPMVHLLWKQGHSVTAMDLVPAALEQMRNQFGNDDGSWSQQEERDNGVIVWKHSSGRATQYQGDALQVHPELMQSFDAVYDKDSFGALPVELRPEFCARMADYTKPGATLYMEVKLKDNHEESKHQGPPFSLQEKDLMDAYGSSFDYVKGLGSVYPVPIPGMQQTGHILKRKEA